MEKISLFIIRSGDLQYFGFCRGDLETELNRLRELWINNKKNPSYKLFDLWEARHSELLFEYKEEDIKEAFEKIKFLILNNPCINKKGQRSLLKLKNKMYGVDIPKRKKPKTKTKEKTNKYSIKNEDFKDIYFKNTNII